MTTSNRPRLRFFENSSGQRHITDADHYLYKHDKPRYRVSVIGTGTIGQEHMRVVQLLGRARVHGIYDISKHSMVIASEEFAKLTADDLIHYDDLQSACNDDAVDAIMICTPNFTHIDVLEIAVKSGKPIFLEKPMATTLADAKRIVALARDYPAFIQVGLQYRYKAPYVEARFEALERSAIGTLKTIAMSEYRPPFLDKVSQWNKFAEKSGGTLIEKCCHYFDLINLFAQSTPKRVFASAGQAVNFVDFEHAGQRSDIDDHAMVTIEYNNGLRASFTLNMFSPHFFEELVICGDAGRLVATETFNFLEDPVARSTLAIELGEMGASRKTDVNYATHIEQSGHHGATFFEHVAFIDRLDGKATDSATPEQGLWSIIVAAAAEQSARSGDAVNIANFIAHHDLQDSLS
ncbi:MAG: Gfo/Idh/MocA family oxidoreductase [Pseudomonadota bacterium]